MTTWKERVKNRIAPPRQLRVLIACEFSGIIREAFRAKGHDTWSCDLRPTEIPGQHVQGDVRPLLREPWDIAILHPDCERLANSGVQWLDKYNLWEALDASCAFFVECLNVNSSRVCVENPIPHSHAVKRIGQKYSQIIQPHQYGHGEMKATCLWLKNLPLLRPTNRVTGREQRVWKEPPGPERKKNRARSFPGIAKAMASQWGCLPPLR